MHFKPSWQGEKVNYIGKTARSIRHRFIGYCNPGRTQQTNLRCNRNIKLLLDSSTDVRIYVCTPPTEFRYGEFQIDLAAGLEEARILALDPPWNGREERRVLTEDEEREAMEEAEAGQPSKVHATEQKPRSLPMKFQIKLGSAYYNQGLINPGVEASQRLGEHGDIDLGDETRQVDSVINRTANANRSVRIVGNNRRIADWFRENFRPGDLVEGTVQDPQHILLQRRNG